jgi:hypothetical protein
MKSCVKPIVPPHACVNRTPSSWGKVVADLVSGEQTPLTRLAFVHKRMPYVGHEPLRYVAVKLFETVLRLTGGHAFY